MTGGYGAASLEPTAELYDPASEQWSSAGSITPRNLHTSVLLDNGKVLVAGGLTPSKAGQMACDLYNPATNTWAQAALLSVPYSNTACAAVKLSDGRVLLTGQQFINGLVMFCLLYNPASGTWATASVPETRALSGFQPDGLGSFFSGYYYERSADGGKTFQRVNAQPYFSMTPKAQFDPQDYIELIDTLPKNYQRYLYRIQGISAFGDLGKFSPNMPVMGRDFTPPLPPSELAADNFKQNDVRLTWKNLPNPEPDLAGYLVGRSDQFDGPFTPLTTKILPPATTSFVDTAAVAWGTNYYVISAIDTAGNAGKSIPAYVIMFDSIPPRQPAGLAGKMDTTGVVHLHWKLGKERDLLGYMVYYANAADHTVTPISEGFIADSTFTDSISVRTLTEKIYYKVVAFDKNRNPSPYSKLVEIRKPDKIPPVPAVFNTFSVSDTAVVMVWSPSSSADLASQVLYRRTGEQGDWQEYAQFDSKQHTFTDRKVQKQTWYEYSLVAVDDANLRSDRSFAGVRFRLAQSH